MIRGQGLEGGTYKPLTGRQVTEIHEQSLHVLKEVGFCLESPAAREIMEAQGAMIDGNIVKMSPSLVEKFLAKAPNKVLLCGRNPENDLTLGGNRVYLGNGGNVTAVVDLETGEKRPALLNDAADIARLVDGLEYIHFYILPVYPTDVPNHVVELNNYYQSFKNTTKHVMGGIDSVESLAEIKAMAEIIVGGADKLKERPIFSVITSIISPLKLDAKAADTLVATARQGIPLTAAPAPMAGATSPVTLAGTLVQQNAESLFGIVLTQMVNPGCPVLYGAVPTTADMRTMNSLFGSVEMGILNACASQISQHYQIPCYVSAGPTDAKLPDMQAGMEKAINTLMVAQAGGNYIHLAAGMLDSGLLVAYEQYVLDNEVNGSVIRVLQGVNFNERTLAIDVIKEVGPGGQFVTHPFTLDFMRSEFFQPRISQRDNFVNWVMKGSLDARGVARENAKKMLKEYYGEPLEPHVEQAILERFSGKIMIYP